MYEDRRVIVDAVGEASAKVCSLITRIERVD